MNYIKKFQYKNHTEHFPPSVNLIAVGVPKCLQMRFESKFQLNANFLVTNSKAPVKKRSV